MTFLSDLLEEDSTDFDSSAVFAPGPLRDLSDAAREEYWATLALRHCKGLGVRSLLKLLWGFGSACVACKSLPQWGQFVARGLAAEFQTEHWRTKATEEWHRAKDSDALILLWKSSLYPQCLRQLVDAPALLYLRGDCSLLQTPCVAVVGSRSPTRRGADLARIFGRDLAAAGITVVSGMALGIDYAAHVGALAQPGRTIGVLGTGIDIIYPRANVPLFSQMVEGGLLVSEFPLGTAPNAVNFPIRNRIISGLSLGVLVVEAAVRSGSLVTAHYALEQNREVFAIGGLPMDAHSRGCQDLIRQGAQAVFSAEDILRDLQINLNQYCARSAVVPAPSVRLPLQDPPPDISASPPHSEEQNFGAGLIPDVGACPSQKPPCQEAKILLTSDIPAAIIACLRERGPLQVDGLSAFLGISTEELASPLLGLELTGQVEIAPGSFYKIT